MTALVSRYYRARAGVVGAWGRGGGVAGPPTFCKINKTLCERIFGCGRATGMIL